MPCLTSVALTLMPSVLLQAPSSLLEASPPLLAPRPAGASLRAWTRLQTLATSVLASKVKCRTCWMCGGTKPAHRALSLSLALLPLLDSAAPAGPCLSSPRPRYRGQEWPVCSCCWGLSAKLTQELIVGWQRSWGLVTLTPPDFRACLRWFRSPGADPKPGKPTSLESL